MLKNKKTAGVALVEILIYTAILGMVGALMGGIFANVQKFQNRQEASNRVINEVNFINQQIQRYVRDASLIENATGTPSTTLVLRMQDPLKDPTYIGLNNGIIEFKEGSNASTTLSNDKVVVTGLNFKKISALRAHDAVAVDFSIRYNTDNPRLAFSKTFNSVIARVNAATFDSDLIPGVDNTYSIGPSESSRWKNANFSGNVSIEGDISADNNSRSTCGWTGCADSSTCGGGQFSAGVAICPASQVNVYCCDL